MSPKRIIKSSACILALSFVLTGVMPSALPAQENVANVDAASKVKLSTKKTYLMKGKTKRLKLSGAKGKVKWTSSKKSVATVSSKGLVRGRKAGTAIITAKYKNKSYKCRVIVESPKMSKTKVTLQRGKTVKLTLKNTKQKVKWSTSNKKIATVTSKGVVKGVKAGKATIYAKVGTNKYKCVVTVKSSPNDTTVKPTPNPTPVKPEPKPVERITLSSVSLSINVGKTSQLSASVYPSDAKNKTLTWTSSNPSVARVDGNGLVTGVAEGTVTITAKTNNGITGNCSVIVVNPLNNAYKTLKNTILNSSSVNSDGNRFIKNEGYIDGNYYAWAIVYEINTDQFHFIFSNSTRDGVETTLDMYVDARKSPNTKPEIIFLMEKFYSGYRAEAVVPIANYSGQDINFTITETIGYVDSSMYNTIQKTCNSELRLAMTGWQDLVQTKAGISLADLGFTSYK